MNLNRTMKVLTAIFFLLLTSLVAAMGAIAWVIYIDAIAEGRPVVIQYQVIRYDV